MKVVKRIIVGVLIAALASAGIYTGLMHVKESKVTEVPVTSVSNLMTDWYSETTLDGTITTNVAQNVNMDKDMIIEKIYVSQGDDVKKGDNLISFDMTLVEMELNIAKLKLQKQEQDLTKAQNRLTSLQNGGPIEDSTDSTDDTELNSTDGNTGDSNMTSTDTPSDGSGDDEMQSTTGSLGTAVDGSYLASASQPLLLSAFTDTASASEESQEADVIDGEETAAGETSDGEQLDEDEDSSDDGLIMDPSYQDPAVDDITDGETPDLNAGDDSTPSVSPTPTPTLGPNELPDPNATEEEIPGITDGEPQFYQKLDYPNSVTFVGSGKLQEIKEYVVENEIGLVIFDDELSAKQLRNIEKELQVKILDRTNLILDIFARRAQTAHAKTQVELAQYKYMLPRLTRLWTHLERQRGGVGMRGPGETQLETDKRIILDKISKLKRDLVEIDKQKSVQRKNRGKMVRVALVGYTNVGKSTLMNLLSKSEVFAENKLFATLDTTVRKVIVDNLPFLLSDTVGFIRKLPTELVESFKSTLDEVREADLLVHVVDISHPTFEEQIEVVNRTLSEIDKTEKPMIMVFNKIDAFTFVPKDEDDLTPRTRENIDLDELKRTWMNKMQDNCIFISAKERTNIDALKALLYERVKQIHITRFPYNDFLFQQYDEE